MVVVELTASSNALQKQMLYLGIIFTVERCSYKGIYRESKGSTQELLSLPYSIILIKSSGL
jgi:hypothetical protein